MTTRDEAWSRIFTHIANTGAELDIRIIPLDHKPRTCATCARVQLSTMSREDFDAAESEMSEWMRMEMRKMLLCSRCRNVYYCNVTCQKAHWEVHKLVCKKTKV